MPNPISWNSTWSPAANPTKTAMSRAISEETRVPKISGKAPNSSATGSQVLVVTKLDRLARSASHLHQIVDTLTAEPKFSGRVLSMLPVVGFFALYYLNPGMMTPMVTTSTGRVLLMYAVSSVVVGYFILMKIADIDL